MAEEEKINTYGRKVFFVHPSTLIQNQVIEELAQEEFEVYAARDEMKLRRALKNHPDAIVFACINEGVKESVWDQWVKNIMTSPDTAGVDVGVISSGSDEELMRKYTEEHKVHCGFTVVKSDIPGAIKQLAGILNSVNAKGRRKYIRVEMDKDNKTTVNIPLQGNFVNGLIRDISVVGFSCSFEEDPELTKHKLFGDIQIRLQTNLLKVEGIAFGSRQDGDEKVHVLLFTKRTDPSVRTRIRKYIQTTLQTRMDDELK